MGSDLPDGTKLSIIQGWSGTAFKNLRVTNDGELYILLSALYNSGVLPLKCDEDGNAFLNVKAQDLAEVINRPKYGGARGVTDLVTCIVSEWTTLFTISGKGMAYGGVIANLASNSDYTDHVRYTLDGQVIFDDSFYNLNRYALVNPLGFPIFLTNYSSGVPEFCCSFSYGITFDVSVKVEFMGSVGNKLVGYTFLYALV